MNFQNFAYEPSEHEAEKASNSYLMSLIAIIAGLPLPIINLLATLIFSTAKAPISSDGIVPKPSYHRFRCCL